jgi:hypothetical protein
MGFRLNSCATILDSDRRVCRWAVLALCLVALLAERLVFAEPASGPARPGQKGRILLVTGVDYPGHLWRQTAPVLAAALSKDPRLEVCTVEDPHFLDSAAIQNYDLVLLHFQNWQQPGPGERARENLRQFVMDGKGRTFHCTLGHDVKALSVPAVQELYRRGCAWACGLAPIAPGVDLK